MIEKSIKFTTEDAKALAPTVSDREVHVLMEAYAGELACRRDRWVDEMVDRYLELEGADLATSQITCTPHAATCDRMIVAVFTDDSRRKIKTGLACCAPDDDFDWRIGTAIAFARAMGEAVPIDLF